MIIHDIHTHDPQATGAIINWQPGMPIDPLKYYSVGVHPWHSDMPTDAGHLLTLPNVVAVGEVGLDKLRGPSIEVQTDVLLKWLEEAERHRLPVILHVVKAIPEIMALKKELQPTVPWIIHGFRGKPETARQLLDKGFYLSLGEKYNPDAAAIIPPDRLFAESDEAGTVPELPNLNPDLPDSIFLSHKR